MARSIRQRRLQAKTDYKARLALLKSNKPRLVIRKTNRYIIVQFVESSIAQDKVIVGTSSEILLSKGWPKDKKGSLKSLPACYLAGFVLGKMAKDKVKTAILDMGMYRNIQKSRIYAALRGVIDSGITIPHNEKSLPSIEEIGRNKNTFGIFDKMRKSM